MKQMGAYEARTHLSRLLDEVERGESFAITKHGRPVALLVPAGGGTRQITPAKAIAGLRSFRRGRTLKPASIRELIDEGRRR
jgi:prevent-host-death family protein